MKPTAKHLLLAAIFFLFLAVVGVFYKPKQNQQITALHSSAIILSNDKIKTASSPQNSAPLSIPPGAKTLNMPILMYHHVGTLPDNANKTRGDLTVPTQNFSDQVKWLSDNGYHSVSLEDVYLYSQGKFSMPANPVVFTFDDGYSDVFQNAIPILKQYGFSGSFAIITNNPGTVQGTNSYASWDDIKTAQDNGMEIACHTQNHFDGSSTTFSADYILNNLTNCKNTLAANGINTNILVYPFGHYTPLYLQQAKAAGFVVGVTVHEGQQINLTDLMQLPRVRVHGAETLQRFEDVILGRARTQISLNTK